MKRSFLIVFMTIFLIFNVKAENVSLDMISYIYKANGERYLVNIANDIFVYKIDGNGNIIEEINVKYIGGDRGKDELGDFWNIERNIIDDFVSIKGIKYNEMYEEFKKNIDDYHPVLFLNKYGGIYVLSPYFPSDACPGSNINITPCDINLINDNFFTYYNINTDIKFEYERGTIDESDPDPSVNNNENVSYTAGTCEGYGVQLRTIKEKIIGNANTKGVCSKESLNAMQSYASLWELKNNFDKSILEKECQETVYNYIDTIENATIFYVTKSKINEITDSKTDLKLACLYMQSEYLEGLALLTSYTEYVENTNLTGCELIGQDIIGFVNDMFDVVKIVSLGVCILLCILDVYKIVVTKESDVTKFKTVLIKRVIALVILFLVPLFVNIVTDLVNDRYLKSNPSKCSNIIRK